MSMCGDGVVGPGSQHQSPLFPDVQPGFDPVMGVGGQIQRRSSGAEWHQDHLPESVSTRAFLSPTTPRDFT